MYIWEIESGTGANYHLDALIETFAFCFNEY